MTELEAVNTVLPYLGDHTVSRVEGSRHPTVGLIIAAMDRQRKALLNEKWWFNKRIHNFAPNTNGKINVPEGTLAVYGKSANVEIEGEWFYCIETGSFQFPNGLVAEIVRDEPFKELPHCVAMYVTYKAALEVAVADMGVEDQTRILINLMDENYKQMFREHTRKSGFNSKNVARKGARIYSTMWR